MNDQEGATQPAREERPQQPSQQTPRVQPEQQQQRAGAPRNERERGGRRRGGGGGGGGHQQQGPARRPEPQLPMEELRDLFALFTAHGLTEFEIEREGMRVHLGRNPAPQVVAAHPQAMNTPVSYEVPPQVNEKQAAQPLAAEAAQPAAPAPAEEESLHVIISPIVGTFYRAPSPTTEPFVRLGSHVDPDSVVCIIEAMKLMNEIQAETSGEIAKIYVENGQPVEYGQPLFGVKK
ncbi:MAG TPA: acetyl-CoA carboxylase biotin carboxyl carrier protein [Pyrinomonadaceae bacterium]|nr:acetyl-CoA carboxylase biotin carboxyl carrier protein [Pyrinomonadaceae bacterium]